MLQFISFLSGCKLLYLDNSSKYYVCCWFAVVYLNSLISFRALLWFCFLCRCSTTTWRSTRYLLLHWDHRTIRFNKTSLTSHPRCLLYISLLTGCSIDWFISRRVMNRFKWILLFIRFMWIHRVHFPLFLWQSSFISIAHVSVLHLHSSLYDL